MFPSESRMDVGFFGLRGFVFLKIMEMAFLCFMKNRYEPWMVQQKRSNEQKEITKADNRNTNTSTHQHS